MRLGLRARTAIAAAGAVVSLLVPASSSAAVRLPVVPVGGPDGRQLQPRPAWIGYTLSSFLGGARDAQNMAGRLRWVSWTSRQALGSGYDWIPTGCEPVLFCPGFGSILYAVDIHLYRGRQEHGRLVFTRMTITYKHARPSGTPRARTLNVRYIAGGFYWSPTF